MKYLTVVALTVLLAVPAFAAESERGRSEASPKQIAMVTKKSKKTHVTSLKLSPQQALMSSLPVEAQDAIENAGKVADKVGQVARPKIDEAIGWLSQFCRQFTEMPQATPAASPYVSVPKVFGGGVAQNVYHEGRIRTCVDR
jgi:hypothetical protein